MIDNETLKILMDNSHKEEDGFVLNDKVSPDVLKIAKQYKWRPFNVEDGAIYIV